MRPLFLGLVAVAALAACTDSTPTGTRAVPPNLRIGTDLVTPTGTLDEEIRAIIALWPDKEEADLLKKWDAIVKKYNDGQTEPKSLLDAFKALIGTAQHIQKLTPKMGEPEDGESRESAASRLIQYMNMYVYGGPDTDPPPYDPEGESAVGFLTPTGELTLITDGGHAGVHFPKGSVGENRTIVITENPTQYGPCDGPLLTELCQYPLYMDIASYPDGPLLKIAQVEICHPPVGAYGGPPDQETHDRLRIAHTKPDNAADYVPGGTIRDTPAIEENIEILPLISQTFLPSCEDVEWPVPIASNFFQRGFQVASRFVSRVGKLLAPRSAYAIDQGGGGDFLDFSPFNNVDPGEEGPTGPTGCEFECF